MSSRSHRKVNFNVSEQYEIIDIIGEGAYGVVAYILLLKIVDLDLLCIDQVVKKLPLKRLHLSIIPCSV